MLIPYGFEAAPEGADDDPWLKLATINEHLQDREPIPPYLARWLGLAILHSNGDADELLRRLDLKRKPGRPKHSHSEGAWLEYGERVWRREVHGEQPEAALDAVLREYAIEHERDVSRTQLQSWRDEYRARWSEAHCR
jgi:hypothetical protein